MDVYQYPVLLVWILLKAHDLKFFYQSVRALYPIQEFYDLGSQVTFGFGCPVFKGSSVEEVEQDFGDEF